MFDNLVFLACGGAGGGGGEFEGTEKKNYGAPAHEMSALQLFNFNS